VSSAEFYQSLPRAFIDKNDSSTVQGCWWIASQFIYFFGTLFCANILKSLPTSMLHAEKSFALTTSKERKNKVHFGGISRSKIACGIDDGAMVLLQGNEELLLVLYEIWNQNSWR
jgi:hypothetical protein